MEEVYLNTISEYREVKTLYDTALNAAVGSQKFKGDWNPDGRSLSEYDRKLMIGPQSMAKFFVKISVTDSVTNRQIAYSSYCNYKSGSVCSSFVRLKNACANVWTNKATF